jgi:ribosomal protein L11 methyltransferase
VERNELPVSVDLQVGSVGEGEPFTGNTYDLVLANIIARILIELNEGIVAFVRPGGILVLSGIIEDRIEDTLETYATHDLELIDRQQEADWLSLVYRKRA